MNDQGLLGDKRWQGRLFTGEWSSAPATFSTIEPATMSELAQLGTAHPADVHSIMPLAKSAQKAWAALPVAKRSEMMRRAAALLEQNANEISGWLIREGGATRSKAMAEIASCVAHAYESAAMCLQPPGLVLPDSGSQRYGMSVATRMPRGVVGVIAPFNYPLLLAFRSVAPALALGNAVVLKPDLRTAVSGGVVIARILEEAGLPAGLFHLLPGGADVGREMCAHADVQMIVFVGSAAAGREVAQVCGRNLKKVTLELGGKNSAIVLDDADVELAVSNVSWATWAHQGQICMATGRILVHEDIERKFVEALSLKASQLRLGDPNLGDVDMGPMITTSQVATVAAIVLDSISRGAQLHFGGRADGPYFPPTVLSKVVPGMRAFEEEIFGPVACVTSFSTDDEAVKLASSTEYGLSASILTSSPERALRLARSLAVGMVHINGPTVSNDASAPFGGLGASGNGTRQGGPSNWDEFTQWQWMTMQDKPKRLL